MGFTTGVRSLIDLRVLGPTEVIIDGKSIRLRPVQRLLLVALYLGGGQLVSHHRLASLIWDDELPSNWQGTLRSHLSHLRKDLMARDSPDSCASLLLTSERTGEGTGYRLQVPDECVDAARFERLSNSSFAALREARCEDAMQMLTCALHMWRGEPFADVASRSFVLPTALRLSMLHRSARTALAEAKLELGMLQEAVLDLSLITDAWPDDIRLLRLMVIALCRLERPGEAATACRAAMERALDNGLDVEPLRVLQQEVLRGGLTTLSAANPGR